MAEVVGSPGRGSTDRSFDADIRCLDADTHPAGKTAKLQRSCWLHRSAGGPAPVAIFRSGMVPQHQLNPAANKPGAECNLQKCQDQAVAPTW
ncbi:hypothetical protein B5P45_22045 [Phyllobacterium zundukense]|uniref:Uncharacterized protein n=1 Tax=Phyllobacterium zundukense TaxID=1867719 RepID=A0A2N9VT33_9HYPH|nr:hypothetical protein BLM14_27520 [Phyllobacterium zundukense]PIO42651.1 hypothetical protein B5P45_22045 [Phyllobacterium zundukense]